MPQPSAGTTSSTTSSLDILTDFRCAFILDMRGQNTVTVGLAYVIILMPGNDIIYLFAFQKVWNNLEDALAKKISYIQDSIAKEKKWGKKCLEICAIKGGVGSPWPIPS